jgi:prevent-host-death family protein
MARAEDIKPITDLKTRSAALIKKLNRDKRPVIITQSGHARAVLVDIDEYEKQRQTLLMLQLAAFGEKGISRGEFIEQESLFSKLEAQLKATGEQ